MKPVSNNPYGFCIGRHVRVVREMRHKGIPLGWIGEVLEIGPCSHWPNCGDSYNVGALCPGYLGVLFNKGTLQEYYNMGCFGYSDKFALEAI